MRLENILILEGKSLRTAELNHMRFDASDCAVLLEGETEGELLTAVYPTESAIGYVASFNGTTGSGSTIEMMIRLYAGDRFSRWFSYGKWGLAVEGGGSVSGQEDEFAKLVVDELDVKRDIDITGVQLKVILSRKCEQYMSPKLRRLAFTNKCKLLNLPIDERVDIDYQIPSISQMVIPDIGNQICSPTSLAMMFAYFGKMFNAFDVAMSVLDNGRSIYGNWTYNVAYAGELGYRAFVYQCKSTIECLELLKSGMPFIASIKTRDESQLVGAPKIYPNGHLLIVRGLKYEDGLKVIVNDPASSNEEQVERVYDFEQFESVWSGIIYYIEEGDN